MNVLVTAGGTTERIDPVRAITNTSTGALGARIAEAFAARTEVTRVFYVAPARAVRPESAKIEWIEVSDTASVEAAVTQVLTDQQIDIAIHSMAISDYRIRAVTTSELLGTQLAEAESEADADDAPESERAALFARSIRDTTGIDRTVKISSKVPDLVLLAEQTPKIIALFHELSPSTRLVGFKLLNGVDHAQLIGVASALLASNHAEFVLANDLAEIDDTHHAGYLVNATGEIAQFATKAEIASGLVSALLG
jgi:phosphopantothenate-cysteine ligase